MNESRRQGLRTGMTIVPTFLAIFIGFGVAAQVADVPAWSAIAMTLAVFAAPAQFAMIELSGQGAAAMVQMILAGILINLRFFLMSLTLTHLFAEVPRRRMLWSAQFVAASSFLLTFFQSRKPVQNLDLHDFFVGVVSAAFFAAVIGTAVGVAFGAGLPPVFAFGASLFLPIYFALLVAGDVKGGHEIAAALCGFALTPPVELLLPGWGVIVSALSVGAVITAVDQ